MPLPTHREAGAGAGKVARVTRLSCLHPKGAALALELVLTSQTQSRAWNFSGEGGLEGCARSEFGFLSMIRDEGRLGRGGNPALVRENCGSEGVWQQESRKLMGQA